MTDEDLKRYIDEANAHLFWRLTFMMDAGRSQKMREEYYEEIRRGGRRCGRLES